MCFWCIFLPAYSCSHMHWTWTNPRPNWRAHLPLKRVGACSTSCCLDFLCRFSFKARTSQWTTTPSGVWCPWRLRRGDQWTCHTIKETWEWWEDAGSLTWYPLVIVHIAMDKHQSESRQISYNWEPFHGYMKSPSWKCVRKFDIPTISGFEEWEYFLQKWRWTDERNNIMISIIACVEVLDDSKCSSQMRWHSISFGGFW